MCPMDRGEGVLLVAWWSRFDHWATRRRVIIDLLLEVGAQLWYNRYITLLVAYMLCLMCVIFLSISYYLNFDNRGGKIDGVQNSG